MDTAVPATPTARLLPSAEGAIGAVLFTFPASVVAANPELVTECLRAVPADATVTVATHASASGRLAAVAEDCGRGDPRILAANDAVLLSLWTQDVVTAFAGVDPAPSAILAMVDRRHGRAVRPEPAIPGGNRLVARDCILIGADGWAAALAAAGGGEDAEARVRERLGRTLDPRPVVVVGTRELIRKSAGRGCAERGVDRRYPGLTTPTSRQPVYHLDMFVTLAGPSQIAPRDLVFVARPWSGGRPGDVLPFPEPVIEAFDEIAGDLAAQGFEVRRLPIALVQDSHSQGRQRLLSWNNGWVEATAHRPRAWVPHFAAACPALGEADAVAAAAWRDAGFEPIAFTGAWSLAAEGGGLHCAGLVTARCVEGQSNPTV